MKHVRSDYDRLQDPAGLIPADEPVFLASAARRWADRMESFAERAQHGPPDVPPDARLSM